MPKITTLSDDAKIAWDNLWDNATGLGSPTLRLGVTGLSRAGKTVFITSLVHNLLHHANLPLFEAQAEGRLMGAKLQPQPDMNLPRFAYERHLEDLVGSRTWPQSTAAISELRITLAYESASAWNRSFGSGSLNIDIVDYPGEWLLDLPLLGMDFQSWSMQALELAKHPPRDKLAKQWLAQIGTVDAQTSHNDIKAEKLASVFTEYLSDCRRDENALSTLPPGRFLMPAELKGSPALTFCPLLPPAPGEKPLAEGLYEQMARRYEAYKDYVVRPFFRNHFARLDRQVVLVDVLNAINAGSSAMADMQTAMSDILACFNFGTNNLLTTLFTRRIDKILFAATKADHLHHENHDKLKMILRKLVDGAIREAKFSGATIDVAAIAAIRTTTEAKMTIDDQILPVIVGTPLKGEKLGDQTFDGNGETAIFPGDLPQDPSILFDRTVPDSERSQLSFVRFRPPKISGSYDEIGLTIPHIRLDKAVNFLISDRIA